MTTAGKRLLQAASEALAIAKGEADPATYVVHAPPETVDVRAIRKGLDMTQEVFGLRFGFGRARIRDWEQGRTRPAASDRVLLTTIEREPDAVLRALAFQTPMAAGIADGFRSKKASGTKATEAKNASVKKVSAKAAKQTQPQKFG